MPGPKKRETEPNRTELNPKTEPNRNLFHKFPIQNVIKPLRCCCSSNYNEKATISDTIPWARGAATQYTR